MTLVSNTGPLIALAKKRGLVAEVTPLLDEARSKGYWLSDRLIALAKDLAGE